MASQKIINGFESTMFVASQTLQQSLVQDKFNSSPLRHKSGDLIVKGKMILALVICGPEDGNNEFISLVLLLNRKDSSGVS